MATVSISVSNNVAAALAPLGELEADEYNVGRLLQDRVGRIGSDLSGIGESAADLEPDELRGLARDIEAVAAAIEELYEPKNRFHEMRNYRGWTRHTMAEMCGVDVDQVTAWERGSTVPSEDDANAMAEMFGVSVDYLVGAGRGQEHNGRQE